MAIYNTFGDSEGTIMGKDGGKIGFLGKAPQVQQANIADVATTAVTTAATSTTPWGFATSTQANNIATLVDDLRTKFNTANNNVLEGFGFTSAT